MTDLTLSTLFFMIPLINFWHHKQHSSVHWKLSNSILIVAAILLSDLCYIVCYYRVGDDSYDKINTRRDAALSSSSMGR